MPRGGKRPGAGRPRKDKNVLSFPAGAAGGASSRPPLSPEQHAGLLEPPAELRDGRPAPGLNAGLLASEKDFWRRWAPVAVDQGTLTAATVPGFRELCEIAAFKEEIAARLAKYGSDGKTGESRLRLYTRLSQRLDAALGRFKLTADGRPVDGGRAKKKSDNPFAQVGG